MPKAKTAPSWPDAFSEFPPDDDRAAGAWFSQPTNRDFSSWDKGRGVAGETAEVWKGLELSLQTVTGQSPAVISKCGRDAAREACGGAGLAKHATTEQRTKIGRVASRALLMKMDCSWKDASATWVERACRTLAPRFIHLWKKTERERKTRLEPGAGQSGDEGTIDAPPEKRAKLTTGESKSWGRDPLPPAPARRKPAVRGLDTSAQIPRGPGYQFSLCDRDIEVRMEPAAEDIGLDTIDWVAIAITAIVHDDALVYESDNIRTEHLSFDKFCRILESTDANFGLKENGKVLAYRVQRGLGVGWKEIHQESDFQVAIGVLAWNTKKEGSGEALVMQIKTTGSL
jgi:hypothetical protein